MTSRFINVLRQAFKTFDHANQATFVSNLNVLRQLTEQLTFQDFHINQNDVLNDEVFAKPESAPCAYLHIFENDLLSMGIFIMRGGYTMPLHDHPAMHGILRGIFGRLRIQSYSQIASLSGGDMVPGGGDAAEDAVDGEYYEKAVRDIPVIAEDYRLVGPETECAILTPRECNFHEISAVGGVAAFFDILSPPYDNIRRCRFYKTVGGAAEEENPSLGLSLRRIPAPRSYYCDTIEAPESLVRSTFNCSAEAYSDAAQ